MRPESAQTPYAGPAEEPTPIRFAFSSKPPGGPPCKGTVRGREEGGAQLEECANGQGRNDDDANSGSGGGKRDGRPPQAEVGHPLNLKHC